MCLRNLICVHKRSQTTICCHSKVEFPNGVLRIGGLNNTNGRTRPKSLTGLTFITPDENHDPKRRQLNQSELSYYYTLATDSTRKGERVRLVLPLSC